MKGRRLFDRDEHIGFRCPRDAKARLSEAARKRTRDLSSLALELILRGLDRLEAEDQRAETRVVSN